jgi:hypothetical protein
MLKPTASFKLSKTTKRMTALMKGSQEGRNQFKKMMIDAELCAEHAKRTAGKRTKDDSQE